jgi:tetratricopeptide (TPR) repeat protein
MSDRLRRHDPLSISLAREGGPMGDATAWVDQGRRARREGRPDDARRAYAEAIAACTGPAHRRLLLDALKGLAQIERDLGRPAAALPFYEEAVAVARQTDDAQALAHTMRHLGDVHRETGRDDLAVPWYREALSLYRSHPETAPLELANAIRPLAIVEERAGRPDEARRLWHEARDLYAAAGVESGYDECATRMEALALPTGEEPVP